VEKTPAELPWNELGNGLPESAQVFLIFSGVKYYDDLDCLVVVLFNFASKI
jgi:hypothetical protein